MNDIVTQEVEALAAIFQHDFTISQQHLPWNVTINEYSITLRSALYSSVVKLIFKFPSKYPLEIPIFNIQSVDLSSAEIVKILDMINQNARSLIGHEMIYETTTAIEDYLASIAIDESPGAISHHASFYDKMNHRLIKEKQHHEQAIEESLKLTQIHESKINNQLASDIEKELEIKNQLLYLAKEKRKHDIKDPKELKESTISNDSAPPTDNNSLFFKDTHLSRYRNDFIEVEFLGRGAYGSVLKCKNKIDGRFYAIKKIKLDPRDQGTSRKIPREVQTLSRLCHQYVVRYYQAWFEMDDGSQWVTSSETDSDISSSDFSDESLNENDWLSHEDISKNYLDFSFKKSSNDSESPIITKIVILYIQMEYCEKNTLRDVIDHGISFSENWRLFRQILEGLHHIHTQGMIHRDFKPRDFGLATVREDNTISNSQNNGEANQLLSSNSSLTGDIGTPVYIAPEITSGERTYNSKVDMYSLGILFFEMCYPFETGMHRAIVLRELRETSSFPKGNFLSMSNNCIDFNYQIYENQAKIIKMLLNHSPKSRPSCQEIMKSPLLPTVLEEQHVTEALRSLLSPAKYPRLVKSLYERSNDPHKDFSYDFNYNSTLDHFMLLINTRLRAHAIKVFGRHGAVELSGPLFSIKNTDDLNSERAIVDFIDASGDIVQLPWNLTSNFARYISRSLQSNPHIFSIKRYTIGNVYRKNAAGGQPRTIQECDFDIVSRSVSKHMIQEAEVIKIVFEILDMDVKPLDFSNFEIRINCFAILYEILKFCKIEIDSSVLNILEKLHKPLNFMELKVKLSQIGISTDSINLLEKFNFESGFNANVENVKVRLSKVLEAHVINQLSEKFSQLAQLCENLGYLGVKSKISFIPLLSYNASYYKGGIMFQISYANQIKDILASGGRYDSLLQKFQVPFGKQENMHAVGVNIAFSKIVVKMANKATKDMRQLEKGKYSEEKPGVSLQSSNAFPISSQFFRRANVLLYTHGQSSDLLKEKCMLLNELWSSNISAEISNHEDLQHVLQRAIAEGYLFIIIMKLRPDQLKIQQKIQLKIKNVYTRNEIEVFRGDVVHYLTSEINKITNEIGPIKKETITESAVGNISSEKSKWDVHILEAGGTGKRNLKYRSKDRQLSIEKVMSAVEKASTNISKRRGVISVDLKISEIKKMCFLDFFSSDDVFDRMVSSLGGNIEYYHSIKRMINRMADGTHMDVCWMYSTIEGECVMIYL